MNILFLTHRLPFPPNRGDRILAYHLLRHLRGSADVDVVSLVHSAEEAAQASGLADCATTVHVYRVPRVRNLIRAAISLTGQTPLTHVLLDTPTIRRGLETVVTNRRPDVVVAYGSGMAKFAFEPPLEGLPLVIHMVDVDSAKWAALAERASPPLRWVYAREARCLGRFEAIAARTAHATVLVAERERQILMDLAPDARVYVMPNGVDLAYFRPPAAPNRALDIVFCGVMDYPPNVEGALWLARHVWPLIRQRYPAAQLKVVGSSPTAAVRALADADGGIEVTGSVPDVRPYLWSASVSVAPLFVARGIQNKVLEAVAAGLPAVITSAAAAGLPADVRGACMVADTPDAFATAIITLMAMQPNERDAIVQRADLSTLGWARALAPFQSIVESAVREKSQNMVGREQRQP